MSTLFPLDYPEGFSYQPAFISADEEIMLLKEIAAIDLHTFLFQGYEANRKVASFGYDYKFDSRSLVKGKDIPGAFHFLITRIAATLSIEADTIAELLVTYYPIGSIINWHRDAPPFDIIAGVSLNTNCTFKLRPHDKAKQGRKSIINVPVDRRSLYVMQGPARTEWEHATGPVKEERFSITVRTLRPGK